MVENPITVYVATLPNERHPERNEDAYRYSLEDHFGIVLDGVGSINSGEQVSALAADYLDTAFSRSEGELKEYPDSSASRFGRLGIGEWYPQSAKYWINDVLEQASDRILYPKFHGEGGTTVSVAAVHKTQTRNLLVWGNIGDSRIYVQRGRKLIQISSDDNLLAVSPLSQVEKDEIGRMIDECLDWEYLRKSLFRRTGEVLSDDFLLNHKSPKESLDQLKDYRLPEFFFRKNYWITQMLGVWNVEPHIGTFPLWARDRILLTTDGVHDNLTKQMMIDILRSNPTDPAEELVRQAQLMSRTDSLRAKYDDMTAMVIIP